MAKKFLSFLGTGNYKECRYSYNDKTSDEVIFVQEAISGLVEELSTPEAKGVIFLTEDAEEKHWADLKKRMPEDLPLKGVRIPGDSNNEAIWEVFRTVFDQLEEGDEVHYDITHSWRYLPMLGMVLLNYASVLKGVEVKGIYYGAFEGKDDQENVAPLLNLLGFKELQDWTLAADQFMRYGATSRLKELAQKEYNPILKETRGKDEEANLLRGLTQNIDHMGTMMRVCDGPEILRGKIFDKIKRQREELEKQDQTGLLPAFQPVLSHLVSSIEGFGEVGDGGEDQQGEAQQMLENGLEAVKWCADNQLVQQGFTLLQESLQSYFAMKHGKDHLDKNVRGAVSSAFKIREGGIPKAEWGVYEDHVPFVERLVGAQENPEKGDQELVQVASLYNRAGKKRNEINHARFNKKTQGGLNYLKALRGFEGDIRKALTS